MSMRVTVSLIATAAIVGGFAPAAAKPSATEINTTSWAFIGKDGTKLRLSVDGAGNYVENTAAGKHRDHGTAVVKSGKLCFTSAMNSDGEVCWTSKAVKVGHSMITTSDKGEKLKVTRIAYRPLSMPK